MKKGRSPSLLRALRATRLRVSLPFFAYELPLDDLLNPASVDDRIARLDAIKADLQSAVAAVDELTRHAEERKTEALAIKEELNKLRDDKATAESLLRLPEDSVTRLLAGATSRGRLRGWVEGLLIGMLTGSFSSLFVWWITSR